MLPPLLSGIHHAGSPGQEWTISPVREAQHKAILDWIKSVGINQMGPGELEQVLMMMSRVLLADGMALLTEGLIDTLKSVLRAGPSPKAARIEQAFLEVYPGQIASDTHVNLIAKLTSWADIIRPDSSEFSDDDYAQLVTLLRRYVDGESDSLEISNEEREARNRRAKDLYAMVRSHRDAVTYGPYIYEHDIGWRVIPSNLMDHIRDCGLTRDRSLGRIWESAASSQPLACSIVWAANTAGMEGHAETTVSGAQ